MAQTGEDGLVPKWSAPILLALMFSAVLLMAAPLLAVAGVLVIFLHWPETLYSVIGAVLLLSAFVLRPRLFATRDQTARPISDFPALEAVCGKICAELGIAPLTEVVINDDFNAWVTQWGLRRTPRLGIGLTLWAVLTPQEQVALLAHECAHLRNRDPLRSLVTANAIHVLDTWDYLLGPDRLNCMDGLTALGYIPFALARKVVAALRYVLLALSFQESQRAEYFADALARQVAGQEACISMMRKIPYSAHLRMAAEKTYYSGDHKGHGLIENFSTLAAGLPSSETERLRRIGEAEEARIDASHPPTASRIRFLEHFPAPPRVTIDVSEAEAIAREFAPFTARMSERLMSLYFAD
jgi:Zn-dependent protease with chaperone function